MSRLLDRFYRYIAIDTKSDEEAGCVPSSPGQLELGRMVLEELKANGIADAFQDEHGYVYGSLASNLPADKNCPAIALIAHLDTSPALDGRCLHPQVLHYEGKPLMLNEQYSLNESDFPFLAELKGQDLLCTDGTTLLGADDKSGVVAAMEALFYFVEHPEVPHGRIAFCATPDEEIGHGAALLDLDRLACDFAYTLDGGALGELEYETFNAASAKLKFHGKSVHPGSAKNIMLNAIELAMEFNSLLPQAERPQHTEAYEGFFMPEIMRGGIDSAELSYIVRDHSRKRFERRKALLRQAAQFMNDKYAQNVVELQLKDSYYNMQEVLKDHMEIVDLASEAMRNLGIEPKIQPVRGGTDGSQLSFRGLPCPNVFAGGYNFHGRFEFIPLKNLDATYEVAREILRLAAAKA